MKGIILAGGTGTRLYPATAVLVKQLLPLYDKPMIYYPLSILMLMGIREVMIITRENDLAIFETLLGNGRRIGMKLTYSIQYKPNGIAEAFLIGRDFIEKDSVCLVLGDNVFYGQGLTETLISAAKVKNSAVIFGTKVKSPSEFGVAEVSNGKVISLEEKPKNPKSNIAVPGLYLFPNDVVDKVLQISKSFRGELEITDLNKLYLKENRLSMKLLGRGIAWLDTGTPETMLLASEFIHVVQERQKNYIACLEEIAFRRGFISIDELETLGMEIQNSEYGKYILNIVEESR